MDATPIPRDAHIERLLAIVVHLALCGVGALLIGFLFEALIYKLFDLITGSRSGFQDPFGMYSPIFWGWSVMLGYFVNRWAGNRQVYWCAILALAGLTAIVSWDILAVTPRQMEYYRTVAGGHYIRYTLRLWFSPDCRGSACLGQFFVTAPCITSVAYSVGAWLGYKQFTSQSS